MIFSLRAMFHLWNPSDLMNSAIWLCLILGEYRIMQTEPWLRNYISTKFPKTKKYFFRAELAGEFTKEHSFENFDKLTATAALNYTGAIFTNYIGDYLRKGQRLKQNGFKLRITECIIGYKCWLNQNGIFNGSLTAYATSVLHYPQSLTRVLTLIDKNPKFVINRLYQLVFKFFERLGSIPFDTGSHSVRRDSVLGIVRSELAKIPGRNLELEEFENIRNLFYRILGAYLGAYLANRFIDLVSSK